ncbi:DUF808 domain-containing protein [Luteimonas huabeiensis]|uniref:DUF808 domain-containing protein n=1 Tax=Luteimonas huabeiensis TaxID=1244513 RepID=UPI00046678EA|nr:DUF808 family protein [Luteimonas huabeiensis]
MAGASLLALFDDIASVLDDVAALTKVAAAKTGGVLGDDLALNAQQVAGVRASREWPVVWAVAKGSLRNKAILVPAALALSAFLPAAIGPLLVAGGLYLCLEGAEKVVERTAGPAAGGRDATRAAAAAQAPPDLAAAERDKVRGAIRTDFVLSAEITVLSLGVVAGRPLLEQVMVMVAIALLATAGVYGTVAAIVKFDDAGLWLSRFGGGRARLGRRLVAAAPWLMRGLTVVGTLAMFLVGGGLLVHADAAVHGWVAARLPPGALGHAVELGVYLTAGLLAGLAALAVLRPWQRRRARR